MSSCAMYLKFMCCSDIKKWVIIHCFIFVGVTVNASPLLEQQKKSHRASVVFCHPEQTFFCVNMTHYSPCIHLDLSNLLNASFTSFRENEFYCGVNRCCQAGAESPCTYHCQRSSVDFQKSQISWDFAHIRKNKKESNKHLTLEEEDRLNKIVSVKSFIIRQKDLEEWSDYNRDYENEVYKWKPSYRTHCPLKILRLSDIRYTSTPFDLSTTTKSHNSIITYVPHSKMTITSTTKTTVIHHISTTIISRKTTKPTIITTKLTTNARKTTKTQPWTTKRITTKGTITNQFTTKIKSKRTTTKPRKPKTRVTTKQPKTHKHKPPSLPCTSSLLRRKLPIPGTCEDYLQCTRRQTKHKKIIYEWKIRSCKEFQFFSVKYQECRKMETVSCKVNDDNRHKRYEMIFNL